jgi:hypothetical protein
MVGNTTFLTRNTVSFWICIINRIIKNLLIPKKLYASEAEKVQIPNPIISETATNKGTSNFASFVLFKKVIAAIGIPAIKKIEIISVDKKMIFNTDLPHPFYCFPVDKLYILCTR